MQKVCLNSWCRAVFEVFPKDQELLVRFDCPEPVMCPDCRHQQRAAFQVALVLYERSSALTKQPIISVYRPGKPYPVYAIKEWWSDAWDPKTFGRAYDFSRPFFEQFGELFAIVPKMAAHNEGSENCDYCASAGQAKDCYYCRTIHRSQHCYYCEMVTGYNDTLCDCLRCQRSNWLYECIQCVSCSSSAYLFRCAETRDSYFSTDLRGCSNCLFCHNLRNKSFFIENRQVAKEEFQKRKEEVIDGRYVTFQNNLKKFGDVYARTIWQNLTNINCENCRGDGLANSSNCYECFHCFNCHGNRYCWMLTPSEKCSDSMDLTRGGIGELLYNSTGLGGGNYFLRMCCQCRKCSELTYCIDCFVSKHCFGCTGLRYAEYCILNKQYTKEEYEELVPRIIKHVRSNGSWGMFFPPSLAPYPYNDSLGQVYLPLPKSEAIERGFQWEDAPEKKLRGSTPNEPLPDSIAKVSDSICEEVLTCEVSARPFKIIPQELQFYRKMRLPLPRTHPDVRMHRRSSMLSPHRLFDRSCRKCGKNMQTSYPPERPEVVYCENCYLQEVY